MCDNVMCIVTILTCICMMHAVMRSCPVIVINDYSNYNDSLDILNWQKQDVGPLVRLCGRDKVSAPLF
jgi:hypothetical protein